MSEKPVYSTATGSAREASPTGKGPAYAPAKGPLKVRLETAGRGGKAVTVLFNLTFPTEEAAVAVMKELQGNLGCGATFKNGAIELRGDLRDRLEAFFAKRGDKLVRAGG
jgi:translation initiation factor 1